MTISPSPLRNGPRARSSSAPWWITCRNRPACRRRNDILGYHVGAPKKLTYYADILKYYQALAAKSPRVKMMNVGQTDEGRECVVVFVG